MRYFCKFDYIVLGLLLMVGLHAALYLHSWHNILQKEAATIAISAFVYLRIDRSLDRRKFFSSILDFVHRMKYPLPSNFDFVASTLAFTNKGDELGITVDQTKEAFDAAFAIVFQRKNPS